jgi:hypothetical protein
VSVDSRVARRSTGLAIFVACAVLLTACSSSKPQGALDDPTTTTYDAGTPNTDPATTAHVPGSCDAIPPTVVNRYTGRFTTIRPFIAPIGGLSCDFENLETSAIVVITIAPGTAHGFDLVKRASNGGGRKVEPVSGLGASAFAISQDGVVLQVQALTAENLVFSVTANVSLARNVALIRELMKLT